MASQCPKCGKSVPPGSAQCTHCDAVLPSDILVGPTTRPGVGGRWDVLEALESLGTQKVYRVRNKTTDNEAALRMLPLSMGSDDEAQERVRNLIGRGKDLLGEDGVLAVVGFEVEDRTPYFITEVFNGTSLQDRLKKEKTLPADEVRRIGIGVATGLASAHRKAFFHGELRPVNVVLGAEEVRVTDFGVGKVVSEAAVKAMGGGMAGPGGAPKAVFYKSPEFLKTDLSDARSDLYALGCILFEALTGEKRLPKAYKDACAEPRAGAPFPDPCGGRTDMDPALRDVIRKLLAPAASDRFNNADEVVEALKGEPFEKVEVVASGLLPAPGAPPAKGPGIAPPPPPAGAKPGKGGAAAAAEAAAEKEPGKPLPVGGIAVTLLVAGLLAAAGWMVWKGGLLDSFRAPREEPEPPPAAPVDAPPALPSLPPPPPQSTAGLVLPPRVKEAGGRIHSLVDGAELVVVPGGDFVLGSEDGGADEVPMRRLQLSPFLVDRHEVTVGQYRRFCEASKRPLPPQPAGSTASHPVVNVTWADANAYARWAGRRLPTEAEWEKAARGGDGRPYPWGPEDEEGRRNGPGDGDGHGGLAPAGSFPGGASPFGALDMAGNAWEWCADWYGADFYLTGPAKDPKGPDAGTERVVRGGSHLLGDGALRASFRNHLPPGSTWEDIGFRCAADLK